MKLAKNDNNLSRANLKRKCKKRQKRQKWTTKIDWYVLCINAVVEL